MYDELVKRLREATRFSESRGYSGMANTTEEAADAIEELSKYANNIKRLKCEGWHLQQSKYHDGYQAIATKPLPEPPKEDKT